MQPKISVVTLSVADVARSRAFYVDGLGFTPRPESRAEAVFLELPGAWLSLVERSLLSTWSAVGAPASGFGGIVLSHNVRTPEEVDAILALAIAAGGRLHVPATDKPVGRIGYFADPDGYLWEVACTPEWTEHLA
jgi:uncharacterized protein